MINKIKNMIKALLNKEYKMLYYDSNFKSWVLI